MGSSKFVDSNGLAHLWDRTMSKVATKTAVSYDEENETVKFSTGGTSGFAYTFRIYQSSFSVLSEIANDVLNKFSDFNGLILAIGSDGKKYLANIENETKKIVIYGHDMVYSVTSENVEEIYRFLSETEYNKYNNYEKEIKALKKIAAGELYGFEEMWNVEYLIDIPSNAIGYAELNQIGGMSYKSKNLLDNSKYSPSQTINGMTFTINDDGTITCNGTTTAEAIFAFIVEANAIPLNAGTYRVSGGLSRDVYLQLKFVENDAFFAMDYGSDGTSSNPIAITENYNSRINLRISSGITLTNQVIKPMLVRGETAPTEYEPYFEGIRDSKVTEVRSVGKNILDGKLRKDLFSMYGLTVYYSEDEDCYVLNGTTTNTYSYYNVLHTIFVDEEISISVIVEGGTFENPDNKYMVFFVDSKDTIDGAVSNWYSLTLAQTGSKRAYVQKKYIGATRFYIEKGITFNNYKVRIAVNKGTTPLPYEKYKGETKPIPPEVQALDGYGLGINEEYYNYIDFDRKVFVQNVKVMTLDDNIEWETYLHDGKVNKYILSDFEETIPVSNQELPSLLVEDNRFDVGIMDEAYENGGSIISVSSKGNIVVYIDPNVMPDVVDVDTFKTWIANNPIKMVVPSPTPIETDISDYLTDDNFIKIEPNSTIEMVNEYNKDMPSKITLQTKEG